MTSGVHALRAHQVESLNHTLVCKFRFGPNFALWSTCRHTCRSRHSKQTQMH